MFGFEMVLAYFIIALIGGLMMRTYVRAGLMKKGVFKTDPLSRHYGLDGNGNTVIRVAADTVVVGCSVALFFLGSPLLLCIAVAGYGVTNTVNHFYLRSKLLATTDDEAFA